MCQPRFPRAGKRSRKSDITFMRQLLKNFIKLQLPMSSKRPDKPRKTSKKVPKILRKALRMSSEMLRGKWKKENTRPKKPLKWNQKKLSFKTSRKEQLKVGKT